MKNTFFILLVFLPFFVLGQDKKVATDSSPNENAGEKRPFWEALNGLEGNIETTLIDDRNFYRSLINFNFKKPHSLSFTAKNKEKTKLLYDQELDHQLFDVEPFLDFIWKFRKSTDTEDPFDKY